MLILHSLKDSYTPLIFTSTATQLVALEKKNTPLREQIIIFVSNANLWKYTGA